MNTCDSYTQVMLRKNKRILLLMTVDANDMVGPLAVGLTPEFSGHRFSPLPSPLLIPRLFCVFPSAQIIHSYFLKPFQIVTVEGELSPWGKGRKEKAAAGSNSSPFCTERDVMCCRWAVMWVF